jgi:hypothetical protein
VTIALPGLPRGTDVNPKIVRFGGDLTPGLGGPILRISRLGSRWQFDIGLPPMDMDCAANWLAARAQADAEGDTLRLAVAKTALVSGAAIAGRTATSGAGAGLVISSGAGLAKGMLFSFVGADGHSYLHMVTAVAGANLHVAPLLRANPAGLALEFVAPVVDGFVDETAWTLQRLRFVGQSFSFVEDR